MIYLTLDQLRTKLGGKGRTTIYRLVENGGLPQPIHIGGRPHWIDGEVDRHIIQMARGSSELVA